MMSNGRASRGRTFLGHGCRARANDQGPASRTTSGPAVVRMAAPTGQTHDCTDRNRHHAKSALDAGAPSTQDPKARSAPPT